VKVVLLGATKGMGRALGRLLIERKHDLFLLGRDGVDVARSARDFEVRGSRPLNSVGSAPCDLAQPDSFGPALEAAEKALGKLDVVIVTGGLFATQDKLESDPEFTAQLLDVNFTGTILFCEAARKRLLASGGGTLCAFSSVAGERGRKPVIIYGAAKAGLSHYLEGLDHKFSGQGLTVVNIKPGFVKTSMTAGLPAPPFAGDPDNVAKLVLTAIEKKKPVAYVPRPWSLIMFIIRLLPRAVMRKLNF
jgi:decaprenylphospho-beta-D-erythro-pentofuranosid-2-ulose 2-reductase